MVQTVDSNPVGTLLHSICRVTTIEVPLERRPNDDHTAYDAWARWTVRHPIRSPREKSHPKHIGSATRYRNRRWVCLFWPIQKIQAPKRSKSTIIRSDNDARWGPNSRSAPGCTPGCIRSRVTSRCHRVIPPAGCGAGDSQSGFWAYRWCGSTDHQRHQRVDAYPATHFSQLTGRLGSLGCIGPPDS